ncbi:unnamed protein product [Danaus chrysippus]|uniref:Myosin light chain alkali n=1 Tax=Danaus chrysippus TaxID=151541 RepID=A0A8J2R2P0_9NEOP|nr:unnamed protein product [Danaus chrysippus]
MILGLGMLSDCCHLALSSLTRGVCDSSRHGSSPLKIEHSQIPGLNLKYPLERHLRASFAFSIYDFDGSGKIDAFNVGDILRALNSNPTLATIEKLGGTKKKGEKQLSLEEFLPIYSQCKKDKDQGCYEDFLECLKLYDKNENGLMLGAELTHTLLALGEKLDDNEVAEVTKDCMDPEDDDGMIPYACNIPEEGDGVDGSTCPHIFSSFLKKMVAGWQGDKPAAAKAEAAPAP